MADARALADYAPHGTYEDMKILVLRTRWHGDVTAPMAAAVTRALQLAGVGKIEQKEVPGAYELPLAAQWALGDSTDAVICLGCILTGETKHNEYIAHAVAQRLMDVSLRSGKPAVFGVLTPDTREQAEARAAHARQYALAVLQMLDVRVGL